MAVKAPGTASSASAPAMPKSTSELPPLLAILSKKCWTRRKNGRFVTVRDHRRRTDSPNDRVIGSESVPPVYGQHLPRRFPRQAAKMSALAFASIAFPRHPEESHKR